MTKNQQPLINELRQAIKAHVRRPSWYHKLQPKLLDEVEECRQMWWSGKIESPARVMALALHKLLAKRGHIISHHTLKKWLNKKESQPN